MRGFPLETRPKAAAMRIASQVFGLARPVIVCGQEIQVGELEFTSDLTWLFDEP